MALPPSVVSGQSNSPQPYSQPTQFENRGYNIQGYPTNDIIGSPSRLIEERIGGQSRTPNFTFPTDLPKYHFTLIENDWTPFSGTLKLDAMYKLPLPTNLGAEHEVNYDTNFNYLGFLGQVAQLFTGGAGTLAAGAGRAVGAATGLSLNTFKTVTLSHPDFRTFQLGWKFSPKNFQEAQTIQKIIFALKKAMHPKTELGKLVMVFPKIFTMYFTPNIKYLYKFKPCVLSSIKVDYNGGQPIPAFYKSPNEPSESPTESVVVVMNFLELEYWIERDFKLVDSLPTNDPFDAFNYYNYNVSPAAGAAAAAGR